MCSLTPTSFMYNKGASRSLHKHKDKKQAQYLTNNCHRKVASHNLRENYTSNSNILLDAFLLKRTFYVEGFVALLIKKCAVN